MKFDKKYLVPFILVAAGIALATLMDSIQAIVNAFQSSSSSFSWTELLATGHTAAIFLTLAFVFFKDKKVYPIFVLISLGLNALNSANSHFSQWINLFSNLDYLEYWSWATWLNTANYLTNTAAFTAAFVILFFVFLKAFKAKEEKKIHKIFPVIVFGASAVISASTVFTHLSTILQVQGIDQSYASDIIGAQVISIFNCIAAAAIAVGCGLYFLFSQNVIVNPNEPVVEVIEEK